MLSMATGATTQERLDAVEGRLSIDKEPGVGATVTGRVPVNESEAAA